MTRGQGGRPCGVDQSVGAGPGLDVERFRRGDAFGKAGTCESELVIRPVDAETVLMTFTCMRDPYKRNTGHNIDADIPERSPSKLERAALTR